MGKPGPVWDKSRPVSETERATSGMNYKQYQKAACVGEGEYIAIQRHTGGKKVKSSKPNFDGQVKQAVKSGIKGNGCLTARNADGKVIGGAWERGRVYASDYNGTPIPKWFKTKWLAQLQRERNRLRIAERDERAIGNHNKGLADAAAWEANATYQAAQQELRQSLGLSVESARAMIERLLA